MRFEVSIEVASLTDGETGTGELARHLQVAALAALQGLVANPGDTYGLYDMNSDPVGEVALIPDWTVGEKVWATTREGTLIESVICAVTEGPIKGFHRVQCKSHTGEPMTATLVDHQGQGVNGEPMLARIR